MAAVTSQPGPGASTAHAPRVLVLSADIGEGHDLPARMLAGQLAAERPGTQVEVVDTLSALGRLIRLVVREGSRVAFARMNWLFDFEYWLITHFRPTRWLARTLLYALGSRGVLRLIRDRRPDVVVATYPGASELLGMLRVRGRLDVPTCSAITDLAALRYWAHPGIDLHLVTHPESIEEVSRVAGRPEVHCVRGLTAPGFLKELDRAQARRTMDLPARGRIVLVSGGGWGVGDLAGAVEVCLERPHAFVVCLCGRNQALREHMEQRFGAHPHVRVLGFTDHMSELLAAADALVHSTAGLTVLEAHMRGCPAISYGWGVAHIRANNEAFVRFGLADVATSRAELARALERAFGRERVPDRSFAALPTAASLVLGLTAAAR